MYDREDRFRGRMGRDYMEKRGGKTADYKQVCLFFILILN